MKTKTIPFAEFRRFLLELGYKVKQTDSAVVFSRAKDDLIVLRRYREDEKVNPNDLDTARTFLDLRGYLDGADFDAFLERATTTAK